MNLYRMLTKSTDDTVLSTELIEARSLDMAALAMRQALRRNPVAVRSELWLSDQRVSVIVRRKKRLVMTEDAPQFIQLP